MTGDDDKRAHLERAKQSGLENIAELFAHALAIEVEAEERYRDLAAQMEVHNNPDVAALFRRLADVEGLHAKQISERVKNLHLPEPSPWDYQWQDDEPPESLDVLDIHYMMTPFHALRLVLEAERNAFAFFEHISLTSADPEIRKLADEMAEEEREHVRLVSDMLERYPKPA